MNTPLCASLSTAPFAAAVSTEAMLFDLDGVLVTSTGGDERCWMRWAEHNNVRLNIRKTRGRCSADTVREHFPWAEEAQIQKHLADLDTFACEEQTGVVAYPGVRELIRSLPPYRWTVVTSASESTAQDRLIRAGMGVPNSVVAADHVTFGKPHPEGYLRAAALLSRRPRDCMVIEDAPTGIRAAKAAGCQVIGVLTSHDVEDLWEADWIVDSLDQIRISITDTAMIHLTFPAIRRCVDRPAYILQGATESDSSLLRISTRTVPR